MPAPLLACSTAAFPHDRLQIALAKIEWAGFRAAEIRLSQTLPAETELASWLLGSGLTAASLSVPAPDPEGDIAALAHAGRAAALAADLEVSLLVMDPPASGSDLADFARALSLLDRALEKVPVRLALRHAPGSALATPSDFSRLWLSALPGRAVPALDIAAAAAAGWDPFDTDLLPRQPALLYLGAAWDAGDPPEAESAAALAGRLQAPLVLDLSEVDPLDVESSAREAAALLSGYFVSL